MVNGATLEDSPACEVLLYHVKSFPEVFKHGSPECQRFAALSHHLTLILHCLLYKLSAPSDNVQR